MSSAQQRSEARRSSRAQVQLNAASLPTEPSWRKSLASQSVPWQPTQTASLYSWRGSRSAKSCGSHQLWLKNGRNWSVYRVCVYLYNSLNNADMYVTCALHVVLQVFLHPNSSPFWREYLLFTQSYFSNFTVAKVNSAYGKCLSTLSVVRDGSMVSHPALPGIEEDMLGNRNFVKLHTKPDILMYI